MSMDLRLGRWETVLSDVDAVNAVICDPPYSERTHAGNQDMEKCFSFDGMERRDVGYSAWSAETVSDFVASWVPRCAGWFACITDTDLFPSWQSAYRAAGLYAFAPVPIIQPRVRLCGDGPASCAVYLMVARPKRQEFMSWGALPGWYHATERAVHIGGKPLNLMRKIVRDYSRPGDLVCDPCAGAGTTLRAALAEGRRAIGAEVDPDTWAVAMGRREATLGQMGLFGGEGANA